MSADSGTSPAAPFLPEEALGRADLLCRSLLTALPGSGVVVFDGDLRVRMAEGPAAEGSGIRTDKSAGRPLADLLPPPVWAQLEPHYRAVADGAEHRHFVVRSVLDGHFGMMAMPLRAADGTVVGGVAFAYDDTERHRTSEELEQRLAQQSAVARLGELALHGGPHQTLLDAACTTVAEALGVELVMLLEHRGEGMMDVLAGVGWREGFVGSTFEMLSFRDPARRADYRNTPAIIEDLRQDTRMRARPLREHGVVSGAAISVGDGPDTLGLLGAYTTSPRRFSGHDLDFLLTVAHVIAAAIERRRTEEQLRHNALHDSLTGLPNRVLLLDRLAHALRRGSRSGEPVALLCLDIDNFKVVNDSLGHAAGDELLCAVAERLREALRPGDTIARFGGDEFAVLCEGVATEADAGLLAARVVEALEPPFMIDGASRFAGASVGVVLAGPGGGRTPEALLADADTAMYRAKERGRGRWELFDAALRARLTARLRIEEDLRAALGHDPGQLRIAYQPIYRLAEGAVDSVEALVRWQHPTRGLVPPDDFIPVAEESGVIVALGQHVLRTACHQLARWRSTDVGADLRLTVNVSARQVAAPGMVDAVAGALDASGLPAAALALEITEGLLLEDSTGTVETLRALQALGVRLVLDDLARATRRSATCSATRSTR
jgi:diguanylate cyclase (GGDEF)-like protein